MGLIDDKLGNDRVNETIRPENIHMYLCNNVTIKDITLKDRLVGHSSTTSAVTC